MGNATIMFFLFYCLFILHIHYHVSSPAGFLLTGAGGGGFLYAITKEAKFSEKVPVLIKGLGVSYPHLHY